MENIESQKPAELVALLRENESESTGLAFLRSSLENINARLDRIESNFVYKQSNSEIRPPNPNHPSRDRFEIPEDVLLENSGAEVEKICPYEPTGKLCDHCSMCSSLGF